MKLTAERLRELLHYNPETGVFTWLEARRCGRTGKNAGTLKPNGYVEIEIEQRSYKAHRLAFLYMTGEWPDADVDHKNRRRADNRWTELRPASRAENLANSGPRRNNTSGFKGVSKRADTGRWRAQFRVGGKSVALGSFDTPEEAHQAYMAAAREHFGEFARPS